MDDTREIIEEEARHQPQKRQKSQVLLTWEAPVRAYKERSPRILRFYIAVSLLLSVIIYFFGDITLIFVVFAALFLFYALTTTPPQTTTHRITTFGIDAYKLFHPWDSIGYAYSVEQFGHHVLVLVDRSPWEEHTYLVLPHEYHTVLDLLGEFIPLQEHPELSFSDKLIGWVSKLMPEDDQDTSETVKRVPPQRPSPEPTSADPHQT